MRVVKSPISSSNTNIAAFSPRAIAATTKVITESDLPVPAGPSTSVLDPLSMPPPSSWSNSAMPLESAPRANSVRCSDATSRGNKLNPPVLMVAS
jgi:hypothetical protein